MDRFLFFIPLGHSPNEFISLFSRIVENCTNDSLHWRPNFRAQRHLNRCNWHMILRPMPRELPLNRVRSILTCICHHIYSKSRRGKCLLKTLFMQFNQHKMHSCQCTEHTFSFRSWLAMFSSVNLLFVG